MTPRGGRGMNTAIADAYDLGWRLAWLVRGLAGAALLDGYEAERGPIGRRNVALSMTPGGGGSDDGLIEDLGPSDGRPGSRAPHVWLGSGSARRSTLDLFGDGFLVLPPGQGSAWSEAVAGTAPTMPIRVVDLDEADGAAVRTAYGLEPGGAVLVRPDGVVAARWTILPDDPRSALAMVLTTTLGLATGTTGAVAA